MKNIAVYITWSLILIVFAIFQAKPVSAQKNDTVFKPKEIAVNEGKVVIYQPQPEKQEVNRLESKAATSIAIDEEKKPVWKSQGEKVQPIQLTPASRPVLRNIPQGKRVQPSQIISSTPPVQSDGPQQMRDELNTPQIDAQQLDRSHNARQQVTNRAQLYNGSNRAQMYNGNNRAQMYNDRHRPGDSAPQ